MGQSGADFRAVATAGLVRRVITQLTIEQKALPTRPFMTPRAKRRRSQRIDSVIGEVRKLHEAIVAGEGPITEETFRAELIQFLSPQASRRDVTKIFRPRF